MGRMSTKSKMNRKERSENFEWSANNLIFSLFIKKINPVIMICSSILPFFCQNWYLRTGSFINKKSSSIYLPKMKMIHPIPTLKFYNKCKILFYVIISICDDFTRQQKDPWIQQNYLVSRKYWNICFNSCFI